jgi:hypothetical protein
MNVAGLGGMVASLQSTLGQGSVETSRRRASGTVTTIVSALASAVVRAWVGRRAAQRDHSFATYPPGVDEEW